MHLDKTNSTVAVYPNNGTRLQVTTKPLKSSLFQIIYTNSSYVLIQSAAQAVRVQVDLLIYEFIFLDSSKFNSISLNYNNRT